jgi:hypothetical protein
MHYRIHFDAAYSRRFLYFAGYDVFLGNFRGLASREHVNKHISAQRCAVQFNFSVVHLLLQCILSAAGAASSQ